MKKNTSRHFLTGGRSLALLFTFGLCLFFAKEVLAAIHWTVQVQPVSSTVYDTYFVDSTHGWSVGNDGTILHTADAGTTWTSQASGTTQVLRGVYFSDANTGWVVGSQGTILHTTDAGATWTPQTSGDTATLLNVAFSPSDHALGFAVGYTEMSPDAGILLKTTDGGSTWTQQSIGASVILFSVAFRPGGSPDQIFVIGSAGTILVSSDNGAHWIPKTKAEFGRLVSITFFDSTRGWIAKSDGNILHSTDGGQTWYASSLDNPNGMYGVSFLSDNLNGWVAGDNGEIVHTLDGGHYWIPQDSGTTANLTDIQFRNATLGLAVGENGTLLRTTDGGTTWSPVTSGTTATLKALAFTSDTVAWAVGNTDSNSPFNSNGVILKTTDGGASWTPQESGVANNLYDIAMADTNTGWIVGNDGNLLKTTDGGSTWTPQTLPNSWSGAFYYKIKLVQGTTDHLRVMVGTSPYFPNSVGGGSIFMSNDGGSTWTNSMTNLHGTYFMTDSIGWAVGDDGKVIHTTDGGTTWNTLTAPADISLFGVAFANSNTGWVVGDSGAIYQTTDAGSSWNPQTSNTSDTLLSISCPSADICTATSNYGSMVHTEDGGANWTANNEVDVSPGALWAVGDNGLIRKSTDNGNSWSTVASGTSVNLHHVDFADSMDGWIVGDNGTILNTSDGGDTWTGQTSNTTENLLGVRFMDYYTGFAVGTNGTILNTMDGGADWEAQDSGTTLPLTSVDCIYDGCEATSGDGSSGTTVLYNFDAYNGNTWTVQTDVYSNQNLKSTYPSFISSYYDYSFLAGNQSIMSNYNGNFYFLNPGDYNDICFDNSWNNGYAVGYDSSSGTPFKVTTDFGQSTNAPANAMAVQTDGKIVAFGNYYDYGTNENGFALARYNATDGSLDTTFGPNSNGFVQTNFPNNWGENGTAVAIQSDGKIVVAGDIYDYNTWTTVFILIRYNSDGTPDTSFGTNGDGTVTTYFEYNAYLNDMVIQPDGQIVVAGNTYDGNNAAFALARYNATDGSLDTTFGPNHDGTVLTDMGTVSPVSAITLQSDGKILVGGGSNTGSSDVEFALARYNIDGTMDTSFGGGNGFVTTPILNFQGSLDGSWIYALAMQQDGKIVAGGYSNNGYTLARYNTDGTMDTGFGANSTGVVATSSTLGGSSPESVQGLAIQPDGKIIAAGGHALNNFEFGLIRLNTDGSLDNGFGTNGNGGEWTALGSYDYNNAVAFEPDGRIVTVGFDQNQSGYNDFALVRYTSDGLVETTGGSGVVMHAMNMNQWNWNPDSINGSVGSLNAITLNPNDQTQGWAVGDNGGLIHTTDGTDWNTQSSGTSEKLNDIHYVSASGSGTPNYNGLDKVFFLNGSLLGWAVGNEGTILHSIDGGASWQTQTSGVENSGINLTSVFFSNDQTGWAVGDQGTVLATADGGTTWTLYNTGNYESLSDVYFANTTHGIAVGRNGAILETNNGGANWFSITPSIGSKPYMHAHFMNSGARYVLTYNGLGMLSANGTDWTTLSASPSDYDLQDLAFSNDSTGYVVGDDGGIGVGSVILTTTDGGNTWSRSTVPPNGNGGLYALFASDDGQHLWASGYYGGILYAQNGGIGNDWNVPSSGIPEGLEKIQFTSATNGWAAGFNGMSSNGSAYHSTDGGLTWSTSQTWNERYANSLFFTDDNNGWVVGDHVLSHTADGGTSWNDQSTGAIDYLYEESFVDANTGWVAGSDLSIQKTTDGGAHWTLQHKTIGDAAFSWIQFTDANNGWAAGGTEDDAHLPVIFHTSNGGATWTQQTNISTNSYIYDGSFINSSVGWLCGTGGKIYKTTNGGSTWIGQTSGTTGILTSIRFLNANVGWAVGSGILLHTTNGGTTWTPQTTPVSNANFQTVVCTDVNTCWAAGSTNYSDEALLIHTTNGGSTWTQQTVNITWPTSIYDHTLRHLSFLDANHGWFVGTDGVFGRTENGGQDWILENSGTTLRLSSIFILDENTGWAVGDDGIILSGTHSAETCGNGVIEGNEACDDGNTASGDGCSQFCTVEPGYACTGTPSVCAPVCGDGIVIPPEICDDGNTTDLGTCNSTCTALTRCGDGLVQNPDGAGTAEQCDDGNTTGSSPLTVTTAIGTGVSDSGYSVAVQPDGKIVMVGSSSNGSQDVFAVARYNSDFSLDTSFGTGGKVTTAIGSYSEAFAVALQSDGKIVVVGSGGSNNDFAMVRYNSDGSLDTSFGTGIKTLGINIGSIYDVAVQSDGKILVAGEAYIGNGDFVVARFNSNGSLDTAGFGSPNGYVTTATDGTGSSSVKSIAIQSDGKIVAAGSTWLSGYRFSTVRYNTDGSLDTSFGGGTGIVNTSVGGITDWVSDVAIDGSGNILVSGNSYNGTNIDFTVARYSPSGTLDTSFGVGGFAKANFGGSANNDHNNSLALYTSGANSGKIVVAGQNYTLSGAEYFALARFNANGTLDTTFNSTGKEITMIDLGSSASSVAIQPDGKIVAGGYASNGTASLFALARYNANGTPDTTGTPDGCSSMCTVDPGWVCSGSLSICSIACGNGVIDAGETCDDGSNNGTPNHCNSTCSGTTPSVCGNGVTEAGETCDDGNTSGSTPDKVTTAIGDGNALASAVAVQPDGKIVVAGQSDDTHHTHFTLARYNSDFSLDTSFGTGGKVTTAFGSDNDSATAVAIQSDGKIVVAGQGMIENGGSGASLFFVLARYNSNGSLDTTFNSTGKVTTAIGTSNDYANSVAIQSDGKIVVGGSSTNSASRTDLTVARYNTDGSLDTAGFGSPNGFVTTSLGGTDSEANAIAIQPDGKIVAAGSTSFSSSRFSVVRYNTDGSLDTSFGVGETGIVETLNDQGDAYASGVAIDGSGNILVSGISYNGTNYDFSVARYSPSGTLDTSFGTSGFAKANFGGIASDDHQYSAALHIALYTSGANNGKIVVAGFISNGGFALARFNTDGTLDTTFNSTGKVTTPFGSDSSITSVAIQSDGKIVAAGLTFTGSVWNFALARYNANGTLDSTGTPDGCSSMCTINPGWLCNGAPSTCSIACGNGVIDAGETCDDASNNGTPNHCNSTCSGTTSSVCGNGVTEAGETCDDGNTSGSQPLVVTTDVGTNGQGAGVVLQPDGKIVSLVQTQDNSSHNLFGLARYNTDGTLDTSFGTNGTVTTMVGAVSIPGGIALQSDGKIVVSGLAYNGGDKFGLARYNSDGSLDTSFGSSTPWNTSGTVISDVPGEGTGVAIQPDGKIVEAGDSGLDFGLARFKSDGSPDTSFGTNGVTTTAIGVVAEPTGIALSTDGKIILGGFIFDGSNYKFALARYNTDGSLDTSFGTNGIATTAIGNYSEELGITIQPDGKILLIGFADTLRSYNAALARYNTDGSLDTSFGANGVVNTAVGNTNYSNKAVLQPDGKIVVSGSASIGGHNRFALARYNADGTLDTGFGVGGTLTTSIGTNAGASGISLESDGKIVAVGSATVSGQSKVALAIYSANGNLVTIGTPDGCSPTCTINPGWLCNGAPSTCSIACGNGVIDAGETCDDASNNGTPNHCNSTCSGTTSSVCGNGIVETGETCDDHNTTSGDGCSSSCQVESGYTCTGTPSTCTPTTCATAPSGLVSWLKGENNANDQTGAYNGTLENGTAFATGKVGQAFSFNGSNNYILLSGAISGIQSSDYTINAWVNHPASTTTPEMIFSQDVDGNHEIRLFLTSPSCNASFQTYESGYTSVTGNTNLCDGAWHHIVATKSGTTGTIYVDGVQQNSGVVQNVTQTNVASIGADKYSGNSVYFFNGLIDEFQVYNRALSTGEIQSIYNAGGSGVCALTSVCGNGIVENGEACDDHNTNNGDGCSSTCAVESGNTCTGTPSTCTLSGTCATAPSGLVSWLKGENDANDQTTAYNGTLENGTAFATGKVGQAFSFNGSNNYISLSGPISGIQSSDYTIDAWVNHPIFTYYLEMIFSQHNDYGYHQIRLYLSPSCYPTFETYESGYASVVGNTSLCDGAWHHVVAVKSGTTGTIYVDGAQQNSGVVKDVTLTNVATIGADTYTGNSIYPFHGMIDEFQVYNRALSTGEIQSIYSAGGNGVCALTSVCGNGIVENGEACDDHNTTSGDGCSSSCQVESGYSCTGTPSVCTPTATCGRPTASTFSGSDTTDLNGISDFSSLSNLKLATTQGSLQWENPVNACDENFDSNVKIGDGFVSLNKSALRSDKNSGANLSMHVSTCDHLTLYYATGFRSSLSDIKTNGQLCDANSSPACTDIQCSGNTATFHVPHFDGYGAEGGEGPAPGSSVGVNTHVDINNDHPVFTTDPSDNGSDGTNPTNAGSNVTLTASASDPNADTWYVAFCKTNAITPTSGGAPSCPGGNWAISGPRTNSDGSATLTYSTSESDAESNAWYAFVCDGNGAGGAGDPDHQCSASSQGSTSPSPFNVNHAPTFGTVLVGSATGGTGDIVPGSTVYFHLNANGGANGIDDNDSNTAQDTVRVYLCDSDTTGMSTPGTCTGGSLICEQDTPFNPNTTAFECSSSSLTPIPTAHGDYHFKVFAFDSHDFAATGTTQQSYTVQDVPPTVGTYEVNDISPTAGGSVDTSFTVTVTDNNGSNDITSVDGILYDTAAGLTLSGGDCPGSATNEQNCYRRPTCTLGTQSGTQANLTVTCDAITTWFNIDPTSPGVWKAKARVTDQTGTVVGADSSSAITVSPLSAMAVDESSLAYGGIAVGSVSPTSLPATLANVGNVAIDIGIHGSDMSDGNSHTIAASNQHWATSSGFTYGEGDHSLVNSETVPGNASQGCANESLAVRPTHGSPSTDTQLFWRLMIPALQPTGTYSGSDTFTSVVDGLCSGTD